MSPGNGMSADPNFAIVLTFTEGIAAGAGNIIVASDGPGFVRRVISVHDQKVTISGSTLTIKPEYWFVPGTVTVTMESGVITDDSHPGTATVNPFAGLSGTAYQFTVIEPPPVQGRTEYIDICIAPGAQACSYTLTHPWYTCHDFQECTVFVRPIGAACGSGAAMQHKKVSMKALQKIAAHGFERNGGDGRDAVLNFAGGKQWPDNVVADFGEDQF